MNILTAKNIANDFIKLIQPYVHRIEIAGSIRREKLDVNDIDIVAIPHSYKLEMFLRDEAKKHDIFLQQSGPKHKKLIFGSAKIELWLTTKEQWGLIYLTRTGSAKFSQQMLATWKRVTRGGYSKNGVLRDALHKPYCCYEESDVFKLCEMKFVEPKDRNL